MRSVQKTCGNVVQSLRMTMGSTCETLSTFHSSAQYMHPARRGKGLLFQGFTRYSYTNISTVIHLPPPLAFAGFYPLSTPPITTTTKNKRKE